MTIKSLHLDTETFNAFEVGIAELPLESPPLHLEPLGDLVVIAGANGAGKSRLLRLVDSVARKLLSTSELANLTSQLFELNNSATSFSLELSRIDDGRQPFDSTQAKDSRRNSVVNTLASIRTQIERAETTIRTNRAVARSSDSTYKIIHFVPRTAQLFDPARDSDNTAMQRSNALMYSGRDSSEVNAPAYARHVLRAALLAWRESNESRQSPLHVEALEAEKSLRAILQELLGSGFHFELNSHLNLELGRKTSESFASELSEGQQVLFQLACMIHSQGSVLRDAIILMDEPENHLHPAALNDVIDKLRAIQGVGQIWIATHSVPLIAHTAAINPDCLWYAENGRFQRAGRTPMRVLHSLMGGGDGAANLQALTMLPAEYATARFLGECLLPPGVVGPDTKDPQTNQIATIVRSLFSQRGRPLRVLDFGAGVGRLLATLVTQAPDNEVLQFVDYRALEPDESKHEDLLHEIQSVYGSDIERRIFTDEYSMKAGLDSQSVDIIVMCNVLHEISPDHWPNLFGPTHPLMTILSDQGYILIVEDYGLATGERAHEYGFILLDEPELTSLFEIKEADRTSNAFSRVQSVIPKFRDRLVAHAVSKECAKRISQYSICASIQGLNNRMLDAVRDYIKSPSDASNSTTARDYAKNAQLFTNTAIWLAARR